MDRLFVLLCGIATLVNTGLSGPLQPNDNSIDEVMTTEPVMSMTFPTVNTTYAEDEREKMILYYVTLDQATLKLLLSAKNEDIANSESEQDLQLDADKVFLECLIGCLGNQECVSQKCLPPRIYFG